MLRAIRSFASLTPEDLARVTRFAPPAGDPRVARTASGMRGIPRCSPRSHAPTAFTIHRGAVRWRVASRGSSARKLTRGMSDRPTGGRESAGEARDVSPRPAAALVPSRVLLEDGTTSVSTRLDRYTDALHDRFDGDAETNGRPRSPSRRSLPVVRNIYSRYVVTYSRPASVGRIGDRSIRHAVQGYGMATQGYSAVETAVRKTPRMSFFASDITTERVRNARKRFCHCGSRNIRAPVLS